MHFPLLFLFEGKFMKKIMLLLFLVWNLTSWNEISNVDFFKIYLELLPLVSEDLSFKYTLNDLNGIKNDIQEKLSFCHTINLKVQNKILTSAKVNIVYSLYLLKLKEKINNVLRKQDLLNYYNSHKRVFYNPIRAFRGARFLIEYGPNAHKELKIWQDKLKKSNDFLKIAKEFYYAHGELKNGYLGIVKEGTIRKELFDLFYNAPIDKKYIGPVKTKYGYLFLKVYEKFPKGYLPFDKVKDKVKKLYVKDNVKSFLDEIIKKEKTKHKIGIIKFDKVPELNEVVLTIDDISFSYKDLFLFNPNIIGNSKNIKVFSSLREKTIQKVLIYFFVKGKIEKLKEYKKLLNYFICTYKYEKQKEIFEKKLTISDKELYDFFLKNRNLFRKKDKVKGLAIIISFKSLSKIKDPYNRHLQKKKLWKLINEIHSYVDRNLLQKHFSAQKLKYLLETSFKNDGVKFELFDNYENNLSRIIYMGVKNCNKNFSLSPIILDKNGYFFVYLERRTKGELMTFRECKHKIRKILKERKIKKAFIHLKRNSS